MSQLHVLLWQQKFLEACFIMEVRLQEKWLGLFLMKSIIWEIKKEVSYGKRLWFCCILLLNMSSCLLPFLMQESLQNGLWRLNNNLAMLYILTIDPLLYSILFIPLEEKESIWWLTRMEFLKNKILLEPLRFLRMTWIWINCLRIRKTRREINNKKQLKIQKSRRL